MFKEHLSDPDMIRGALEARMEAISVIRHLRYKNQYRYPENTFKPEPEENLLSFKLFGKDISNIKDAKRHVNIVAHFIPPLTQIRTSALAPLPLL